MGPSPSGPCVGWATVPDVLNIAVTDARIVDGSGSAAFHGAIAIAGDRIAWVGRDGAAPPAAMRTIDAGGLVLAPGFVDVHNHSDLSPLVLPEMPSTIRQGVTTVVVGNCGSSPFPLAGFRDAVGLAYAEPDEVERPAWRTWGDYVRAIDAARPAANIANLVGHGSVRLEVMGMERRPPSHAELDRMRALVREAMAAGALGLSTGLIYVPGLFTETEEVVAVAEEVGRAGGLYASHIRNEARGLFPAIDEALTVGDRAGLPVHISHLKCESASAWGRSGELLDRIHDAADATADQYPYTAWNSSLSSFLPAWAPVEQLERVARDQPERLRADVEDSSVDGIGWDHIAIVGSPDGRWNGSDVASIAEATDMDPFAAFVRLLLDDPDTMCIGHAMHEDDVEAILADPAIFVASDGSATSPAGARGELAVHPREYGTFPRALALCRDHRLLPLEAAVRKMTSLPAERFGLRDRGTVREGAFADLVLFDPATIRDTGTFGSPHGFPHGIDTVVVNGTVAWERAATMIARSGRVLRR